METGIFIRAKVEGKWESVDIGDSRLSAVETLSWLRSRGGHNAWAENTVLLLLGKEPVAE